MLIDEPVISGIDATVGRYLPSVAAGALDRTGDNDLTLWTALAVCTAYVAVVALAALDCREVA